MVFVGNWEDMYKFLRFYLNSIQLIKGILVLLNFGLVPRNGEVLTNEND